MTKPRRVLISKTVLHTVLVCGSIVFSFPLVWLISTSLKPDTQIFVIPPQLIPNPVVWENYVGMWKYFPFMTFLMNTVFVVFMNMVGTLLTAPMVAYAFARLRWKGRGVVFAVLLGTMMLPDQVTMVPLYVFFNRLGWINTFYPLWIRAWFGGKALNVFLLRQFMMTIPGELEESALIDGAGRMVIYTRIMLPLVIPVLMTVAIFTFKDAWNDFMGPLLYINDSAKYTLSLGLRVFQQAAGTNQTQYGMMMAATVVMTLPVVVFFFIGQKQFIEGVVLTGLKA